jgi:hypothetical protein
MKIAFYTTIASLATAAAVPNGDQQNQKRDLEKNFKYFKGCVNGIGLLRCKKAAELGELAKKTTFDLIDKKVFKVNSHLQGKADGFRHCYWLAMFAKTYGSTIARRIGVLHEDVGWGFNTAADRHMDLYNNDAGIAIGVKAANHAQSQKECMQAALQGRLITLKDY